MKPLLRKPLKGSNRRCKFLDSIVDCFPIVHDGSCASECHSNGFLRTSTRRDRPTAQGNILLRWGATSIRSSVRTVGRNHFIIWLALGEYAFATPLSILSLFYTPNLDNKPQGVHQKREHYQLRKVAPPFWSMDSTKQKFIVFLCTEKDETLVVASTKWESFYQLS